MHNYEFISPRGGTLVWVPGDEIQEIIESLTPDEADALKSQLAPIFNRFVLTLSGMMVDDVDDRKRLLEMYDENLKRFISMVIMAVRSMDQGTDDEGNESGNKD